MTEEKKVKALSLDGVVVPYPCGISASIDEDTGFGMMTLIYATNPDDCYISRELMQDSYGNPTSMTATNFQPKKG